jgi:predicted ATPase
LQASLLARLDRLGGEARELAQLAAVIGREFDIQLLCAVTDKKSEALRLSLDRLVGSEIVLPAGSARYRAFVFRHALIQEAAYQSLLLARRRQYHCDVACALEAMQPDTVEPEIIAQHYTAAELPEKAVPHWLRAGERALARFAGLAAAAHFERGLQLARGLPQSRSQVLELLLALGSALDRTERLRDALATFKEAATLALEVANSPKPSTWPSGHSRRGESSAANMLTASMAYRCSRSAVSRVASRKWPRYCGASSTKIPATLPGGLAWH